MDKEIKKIEQDRVIIELDSELIAKIDFLIEKKLYQDRVTFIDQALKAQLNVHQATFDEMEKSQATVFGLLVYSSKTLEKIVAKGKKTEIG